MRTAGSPDGELLVRARLQSIDGLRGMAALAVVLLHASDPLAWMAVGGPVLGPLWQVVQHGGLGVALFFVISGFCIHQQWARQHASAGAARVSFRGFWRRRFQRLYPAYLVALSLCMLLVVVSRARGSELDYPSAAWSWLGKDFVVHALMLHGLQPLYDYQGGNTVFWTLAREEYLYAMYFPLLALRGSVSSIGTAAIVFLLGVTLPRVTAAALAGGGSGGWTDVLTYAVCSPRSAVVLWIQWTLGVVAVEHSLGMVRLPRWCRWVALAPLWAAGALASPRLGLGLLAPAAWGMAFFTLVNWAVANESRLRASTVWNVLARVGVFSYSLYLVHLPTITIVHQLERVARRAFSLGDAARTTTYQLLFWIACIGIACAAGRLFFEVVERRFLVRRRG